MPEYISVPIETEPEDLKNFAIEYLIAEFPGWAANAANLETAMLEAMAGITAEARDVASDVPAAIFRYYGASVANIPPVEATSASGFSTWTAIDTAGYTIEAGTVVGIPAAGDELIPFEVVAQVVIPPASSATAAGEVELVAVDPGADGNGLSDPPVLIDVLDWVDSIVLTGATSGGEDAEDDDDYLNRLREELQLLTPRPILPNDFAVLAKKVTGVHRALAIDGLIPPGSYNNERAIAIAVVDENGDPCSAGVKTDVDDYLQSLREVNFIVNVIDPDVTAIDVTFAAMLVNSDQYDAATVETEAEAAVSAYLASSAWGVPRYGLDTDWELQDTVRYLEIAEVINRVDGIDYITSLTVEGGTADVSLSGDAPLTEPGTISGTVTAP